MPLSASEGGEAASSHCPTGDLNGEDGVCAGDPRLLICVCACARARARNLSSTLHGVATARFEARPACTHHRTPSRRSSSRGANLALEHSARVGIAGSLQWCTTSRLGIPQARWPMSRAIIASPSVSMRRL